MVNLIKDSLETVVTDGQCIFYDDLFSRHLSKQFRLYDLSAQLA